MFCSAEKPKLKKTVTLRVPPSAVTVPAEDTDSDHSMDKSTQTGSHTTMASISGNSESLSKLRKSLYASSKSKSFSSDQAAAAALQQEKILARKSTSFTEKPTPSRCSDRGGPNKMRRSFGQGLYHSFDQTLSRQPYSNPDLAPLPENSDQESYCSAPEVTQRGAGPALQKGPDGVCGKGQGVGDVPYDWTEYRLFRERMNRRRSTGSHSIKKFNRLNKKRHR